MRASLECPNQATRPTVQPPPPQIAGLEEYQKASDALYKIVTDKVQKYLSEPWTSPDVEALDAITFKVGGAEAEYGAPAGCRRACKGACACAGQASPPPAKPKWRARRRLTEMHKFAGRPTTLTCCPALRRLPSCRRRGWRTRPPTTRRSSSCSGCTLRRRAATILAQ